MIVAMILKLIMPPKSISWRKVLFVIFFLIGTCNAKAQSEDLQQEISLLETNILRFVMEIKPLLEANKTKEVIVKFEDLFKNQAKANKDFYLQQAGLIDRLLDHTEKAGQTEKVEKILYEEYVRELLQQPRGGSLRDAVFKTLETLYQRIDRNLSAEFLREQEHRGGFDRLYAYGHVPAFDPSRTENEDSQETFKMTFDFAQAISTEAAKALSQMAVRHVGRNRTVADLLRDRQRLSEQWKQIQKNDTYTLLSPEQLPIEKQVAAIDLRLASLLPDYAKKAIKQKKSITEIIQSSDNLNRKEVQEYLQPSEALVTFGHFDKKNTGWDEEFLFVWVITKTEHKWVRAKLGKTSLADQVSAIRCGLDRYGSWSDRVKIKQCKKLLNIKRAPLPNQLLPFDLKLAYQLYKGLFEQIEGLIKNKNLLLVPSGPLTQFPFQVLVTEPPSVNKLTRTVFSNAAWLPKKHNFYVLPSVSSIKALREQARESQAEKTFIGFANPLLNGNEYDKLEREAAFEIKDCSSAKTFRSAQLQLRKFTRSFEPIVDESNIVDVEQLRKASPLPETADELCEIAQSLDVTPNDIYLGANATEANIRELNKSGTLSRYRILHFATHGVLAGELSSTSEPGLILTPPDQATTLDDGYLSASEISSLTLDANWVILSACNTAGGGKKNAEALSGLARAFFYAGARSLLVSHWYVDSKATVSLITKTFDALQFDRQIGRAEALRSAMLFLIKSDEQAWHPALWAPFVLVGEGARLVN